MANFTPQEIEQFLQEFFDVVGARQYIGARYVPIFGRKNEESIIWDNTAPYEPLTIVLYQGNSFTSRQYVPEGVEITNSEYWANTGNYNAQVEQYRRDVALLQEQVTEDMEQLSETLTDAMDQLSDDLTQDMTDLSGRVNGIDTKLINAQDRYIFFNDWVEQYDGDNDAAIAACLAYCASHATGAVEPYGIIFDTKAYTFTQTITLDPKKAYFIGRRSRLVFTNVGGIDISTEAGDDTGFRYTHNLIENMQIEGTNRDNTSNFGIRLSSYSNRVSIENVNILGFNIGVDIPNTARTTYLLSFIRCYIYSNVTGISILSGQDSGENVNFENCVIADNINYGLSASGYGKSIFFDRCSFDFNGNKETSSEHAAGIRCVSNASVFVNTCHLETSNSHIIAVENNGIVIVSNSILVHSGAKSLIYSPGNSVLVELNHCTGIKADNTACDLCGVGSIQLNGCKAIATSGTVNYHNMSTTICSHNRTCEIATRTPNTLEFNGSNAFTVKATGVQGIYVKIPCTNINPKITINITCSTNATYDVYLSTQSGGQTTSSRETFEAGVAKDVTIEFPMSAQNKGSSNSFIMRLDSYTPVTPDGTITFNSYTMQGL